MATTVNSIRSESVRASARLSHTVALPQMRHTELAPSAQVDLRMGMRYNVNWPGGAAVACRTQHCNVVSHVLATWPARCRMIV